MAGKFSDFDQYRVWARDQFGRLRGAVGFLETRDHDGNLAIGTCFHVGDGSFVTARHVVEDRTITALGFDDDETQRKLIEASSEGKGICLAAGPFFHQDDSVDIACFKAEPFPPAFVTLGGHLDDWLGQYELVLYRTMVLGYPPIPFADRPVLTATVGEVNALIDKYTGGHPHFVVSMLARGGFSGGPALVAYNECDPDGGTALLGIVTESLTANGSAPELGYMAVLTVEPIYDCLESNGLLPKFQAIAPKPLRQLPSDRHSFASFELFALDSLRLLALAVLALLSASRAQQLVR